MGTTESRAGMPKRVSETIHKYPGLARYLQGRGMAFIPWLVRGLQRWTRRCLQRKRRQRVLDALEQARAHGQPNWLDSLPLDLLTRGVLARL